jgi:hypothetical protein
LRYLDGFAKPYGKNKKLGSVFIEAVTHASFPTKATKFPFLRAGFLACNVISPRSKVVDGVARLLTKTDVSLVCKQRTLGMNIAAETLMAESWATLQDLSLHSGVDLSKCNAIFGRLSCRTILMLVKKEADGVESKVYGSLSKIKAAFNAEIKKAAFGETHEAIEVSSSVKPVAKHIGLQDVSGPTWIASQNGFTVGETFMHKQSSVLYTLHEFTTKGARFIEHFCWGEASARAGCDVRWFVANVQAMQAEASVQDHFKARFTSPMVSQNFSEGY